MNKETVIFFQQFYIQSILNDKILDFCKQIQLQQMKQKLDFSNRILITEKAKALKEEYDLLEKKVLLIQEPEDILSIQKKFENIMKKLDEFFLHTMQSLSKKIFVPEDINVLYPIFENYSIEKIKHNFSYLLYYELCKNGLSIRNALNYFIKKNQYKPGELISLVGVWKDIYQLAASKELYAWRYEQIKTNLQNLGLGEILQFHCVEPRVDMHGVIAGVPVKAYEHSGESVTSNLIYQGQGEITNINPKETNVLDILSSDCTIFTGTQLFIQENVQELDFSNSPLEVLNIYFNHNPFVIKASDYFRFANSCVIFQRMKSLFGNKVK